MVAPNESQVLSLLGNGVESSRRWKVERVKGKF
jgi:hypothetical protein